MNIKSLFNKISLRKKLFVMPMMFFLLSLILWAIFYNLIHIQTSILKHLSKDEINSIKQISMFFSDISENHSKVQSLLLDSFSNKDTKIVKNQKDNLLKDLKILEKRYKNLHLSSEYDIKSFFKQNIDRTFDNYISSTSVAISMSSNDYQLINFYLYSSNGDYALLNSDFQNLINEIESHIQKDVTEGLYEIEKNFQIFLLTLFISILIMSYLVFGVSKNLSFELNEILETIKALSRKEIEKPIPIYKKGDDFFQISIALEKLRVEILKKQKAEMKLKLNAKIFENTAEMIMVTDEENKIIEVNRAFTKITGYSKEEVLGKNPNILKSGYQNQKFYEKLWRYLLNDGYWQGELWNRKKNGSLLANLLTISTLYENRNRYYIAVAADITKLKESQDRAEFLAYHDTLTNLPNRILFIDRLEHAIKNSIREQKKFAVLFIDLDRFKNINDTLGHPIGDILLQEMAQRIKKSLRPEDTIARLGGDEFIIIVENIKDETLIIHIANRLLKSLSKPVVLNTKEVVVTISLGISVYPADGEDVDTLIKNADTAMYLAKSLGRDNFQFYSENLTVIAKERFALENDLRKVLQKNELTLKYQPQVSTINNKMIGVEVLLRWKHQTRGFINPELFIKLAEEIGMINDIGRWVFEESCKQTKIWQNRGINSFRIAINLSVRQLMHPNLIYDFKNILKKYNLEAKYFELEITESYIMEHIDRCIETLNALKNIGFTLAIDDFGTGYSSLSYLKKLPIQRLKVDKSFVLDIYKDSDDMAITTTILAMGKILGLDVIAEGVEQQEQLDFLIKQGCKEVQGYYFSKPLSSDELEIWYKNNF